MAKGTKNPLVLKLVILAIALQEIGGGAASPVLASIMAAYPNVNPTHIMLIQTMPSITTMIMAPICGKLADYIPKRTLSLAAVTLFIVSGVAPAFMDNLVLIYIARAFLGVAIGMAITLVVSLVADFFDGNERAAMMGYVQTVGSLGGMYFQLAGGFLGAIDWHYAFYAYLVTILVLVFTYVALPEPPKKTMPVLDSADASAKSSPTKRFTLPSYLLFFSFFMIQMLIIVLVTNTSVMIANEGYGDAADAGIALTAMTLGGLIASTCYGQIYKLLKKFSIPPLIGLMAIGYFIIYFANGLTMIYVGSFITGLGVASAVSGSYQKMSLLVPPAATTFAMSLMVFFQGLGNFIEPFVFERLLAVLNMSIGRQAFIVAGVILAVQAILVFIWSAVNEDPGKRSIAATEAAK